MSSVPGSHFHNFAGYDELVGGKYSSTILSNESNVSQDDYSLPSTDPTVREMFSKTQIETQSATAFHEHPVVLMVVNFMQKVHTWSWRDHPVHLTIFPGLNLQLSPNQFDIQGMKDSIYKNDGSFGLLAKCFYNGYSDYSGDLNDGKFNSAIASLNTQFDQDKTYLYAAYFRHAYGIAPTVALMKDYTSLLLSRPYRVLKQAQLRTGKWPNPSMEIFLHFTKLLACGASMQDVNDVYASLTSGPYGIDPSAFPSIAPDIWTSYSGWLASSYLDWSDLQAQNLRAETWLPGIRGGAILRLVAVFANWFHYWKPSGSCFNSNTLVVMADGDNVKKISEISPGDQVLGALFEKGELQRAPMTVAFISQPKRLHRTLYSFAGMTDVQFTGTHPLVKESNGKLLFEFIDPESACAVNQCWKAVGTKRIPIDEGIVKHDGRFSDVSEVLYNLVFAQDIPDGPSPSPVIYTVADSTGKRFDVASESPVFYWLPYVMTFFESVLGTVHQGDTDVASIANFLTYPDTIISTNWESVKTRAWESLGQNSGKGGSGIFHSLASSKNPQAMVDAFESLHTQLGRNINHEIQTGWSSKPASTNVRPSDMHAVLLVNSLHFLGLKENLHDVSSSPPHRRFKVRLLLNEECLATKEVNAGKKGWNTFEIHQSLDLRFWPTYVSEDGIKMWKIGLEIVDLLDEAAYRGRGVLYDGRITQVGLREAKIGHQAILDLRVTNISQDVIDTESIWDEDMKVKFARALGAAFATQLKKALTKPPTDSVLQIA